MIVSIKFAPTEPSYPSLLQNADLIWNEQWGIQLEKRRKQEIYIQPGLKRFQKGKFKHQCPGLFVPSLSNWDKYTNTQADYWGQNIKPKISIMATTTCQGHAVKFMTTE